MNNSMIIVAKDADRGFLVEVTLTKEYAERLLLARDQLQGMRYEPNQMLYGGKHPVRVFFKDAKRTPATGRTYGRWREHKEQMPNEQESPEAGTILHVARSGVYWNIVTERGSEVETPFLDWRVMEDITHEPLIRYEVSVPDMYHPGEVKTSATFEHRKDAIEFARQWGADYEGNLCLVNEIKS